jgi:S-adenosylmethionine hydrolase
VIALLTDFGLRDHYAGTMKGVVLGICPDATLVDISHDVAPHDVLGAALELAAAYRYFPAETIFLAVVDPGVGSARRAIAVEAGSYRFVAPDNGVLSLVLDGGPVRAVELAARRYSLPTIGRTFEGRDRFAPAAAWLATGIELAALGPDVADVYRLNVPAPSTDGETIVGEVLRTDRFGNLVTNIDRRRYEALSARAVNVRVGGRSIAGVVETYADAAPEELCALFGSSDHLEIAVRGGNAAERLDLGRGAPVHIVRLA